MKHSTFELMTKIAEKFSNEVVTDWMYDTKAKFVAKHGQGINDQVIMLLKENGVSKSQIEAIN